MKTASAEQLKRLANDRHVSLRRKDEEISNLRSDLSAERERTSVNEHTINQLLNELSDANGILVSLHGRIRLIEKLAGDNQRITDACKWCLARIEGKE